MTSLLPALLLLAAVDAINPASITGALYLARPGRRGGLKPFILAVYLTYLLFGLALVFGPGVALRSTLVDNQPLIGSAVEVVVGVLLVRIGLLTWRWSAPNRERRDVASRFGGRSALPLGSFTTLADLPTAGPLFAATVLIAATNEHVWLRFTDLLLYDVVYVAPLVAVALADKWITSTTNQRPDALAPGSPWLRRSLGLRS